MSTTKHTPGPWSFARHDQFGEARFYVAQAEGAPYTPNYSDVATLIAETVSAERVGIQEANARLIAAAPDLLEALQWREQFEPREGEDSNERFERIAETFRRETGYLRPGKDCRMYSIEERQAVWDEWMQSGRTRVRAAIAKATGVTA